MGFRVSKKLAFVSLNFSTHKNKILRFLENDCLNQNASHLFFKSSEISRVHRNGHTRSIGRHIGERPENLINTGSQHSTVIKTNGICEAFLKRSFSDKFFRNYFNVFQTKLVQSRRRES